MEENVIEKQVNWQYKFKKNYFTWYRHECRSINSL